MWSGDFWFFGGVLANKAEGFIPDFVKTLSGATIEGGFCLRQKAESRKQKTEMKTKE